MWWRNGNLQYLNIPSQNKRGSRTPFSVLMPSHSTEREHLLDGFRSSPIWRRFVSYANRPVVESRSTGTKWRRPPTLFRIQTSKTLRPHRPYPRFRHGRRRISAPSVSFTVLL